MVDISVKVPDVVKSNKPEVKSDEETESKGYDYHEPPAEVHHKEEPSKTKPHEDPHHSTTHEKELSKTKPHEDPHSTTHDNNAEIPVHKPGTQSQDVKLTVEDGSKLSFKEKMKRKNIPGGLTINAFLLLLAGSQNIWCLAFVVLLCTTEFIGISFIREFMTLHWWISLIALGIYMCIYLVTWRMKVRLRVSAACFFLIILATICESTLIVYMALYIDLGAMVSAMVQITFSLYLTACLAQCMKTSYTSILGRTVAIASSLISLIFFMTFEATTVQVVILVTYI